jgi:hypothetical protein
MRISDLALLTAAGLLMLVALFYENIDIAGGDDHGALLIAVVAMTASAALCLLQFLRSRRRRWLTVLIAAPSLFVIWDLSCRSAFVRLTDHVLEKKDFFKFETVERGQENGIKAIHFEGLAGSSVIVTDHVIEHHTSRLECEDLWRTD